MSRRCTCEGRVNYCSCLKVQCEACVANEWIILFWDLGNVDSLDTVQVLELCCATKELHLMCHIDE